MIFKRIQNSIMLSMLICSLGFKAQAADSDFDGVADNQDKCPDSKITDIVDKNGCVVKRVRFKSKKLSTIKKAKKANRLTYLQREIKPFKVRPLKEFKLSAILGIGYAKSNSGASTNYKSLSLVYSYDKVSTMASFCHSKAGDAIDDLTLAIYYTFNITPKSTFELGGGSYIALSSKKENKTDYFLSAKYNYYFKNYNIGIRYEHTFMHDLNAKDGNLFNLSFGAMLNKKVYMQFYYETQNAIYKNQKRTHAIGLYGSYTINKHWFISAEFKKDFRHSNNYDANFNLGYLY